MPNETTNYKLTKPLPEEFYDVEVQNANMDIIDGQLKSMSDRLDNTCSPADVEGLLSKKADRDHTHTPSSIGAASENHSHNYSELKGIPSSFTPSAHSHNYNELTGVPSSFTPSAHSHSAGDINSGTLPVERGGTGNTSVDTSPVSGSSKMVTSGGVYAALSGKANSSHNQAASTITAGTFGGQVVANSSGQTYSTYLLRNTRLASSDTNPTTNGQICWTYA